jgi:hypothetical protein
MRPVVNFHALASGIVDVIEGHGPDTEEAYLWVRQLSWANVCKDWEDIIIKAVALTEQRRRVLARNKNAVSS